MAGLERRPVAKAEILSQAFYPIHSERRLIAARHVLRPQTLGTLHPLLSLAALVVRELRLFASGPRIPSLIDLRTGYKPLILNSG